MSATRRHVLGLYKQLHRTAQKVFVGDAAALGAARDKIHADFAKNKDVTSETSLKELTQLAADVRVILEKQVVQAEATERGTYKLNLRDEHPRWENTEFRDDITRSQYREANRHGKQKCKDYE